MDIHSFLSLLPLGILGGILSSLLGVGGGLLMVPCLTAFDFGILPATTTSLVGIIFSSVWGSIRNWQAGQLDVKRSLGLAIGGIPAAQFGVWLGEQLTPSTLAFAFAGFQMLAMYLMSFHTQLPTHDSASDSKNPRDDLDKSTDIEVEHLWIDRSSILIGVVAGILAGLFGVGGGVVMVPLQMVLLSTPIKEAVCTSLGAIIMIGISGLLRHAWLGHVLWLPGFCLGCGGVIGAQIGAWILPHLSPTVLSVMFRCLLTVMAIWMVYEGWITLPS